MNQLFIPNKIKIGFQSREDTYTKRLAYVIYWDLQGKLRKEASWNSWRDEKIEPEEFENTPVEGFVLNKGVGGQRQSYHWNARNEYIRVYDPRDFEFEISVANLLFILRECDCSKGKGLEGKFVYAWDGKELVLLPTISQDYQKSKDFTSLQNLSIKSKDLIKGAAYETKSQDILIYIGKFDYYHIVKPDGYNKKQKSGGVYKRHVFYGKDYEDGDENFVFLDTLKQIAKLQSENIVPNYAELVDKYYKSSNGSKVVSLFTKSYKSKNKDTYPREYWTYQDGDNYIQCYNNYEWNTNKITFIQKEYKITLKDGVLISTIEYEHFHPPGTIVRGHNWLYKDIPTSSKWIEPTNQRLYARLESGSESIVDGYSGLITPKEFENG